MKIKYINTVGYKVLLLLALACMIAIFLLSCGSSDPIITEGKIAFSLSWAGHDAGERETLAVADSNVITIRIIVTGTEINAPIQEDYPAHLGTASLTVPANVVLNITVRGLDENETVLYEGKVFGVMANPNYTNDIGTIVMQPVETVDVDTTIPSTPSYIQASAVSSEQIDVTWDTSTDNNSIREYWLYRDGQIIASTEQTTYSDSGLSELTTYCYKVKAVDAAGNESEFTPTACSTTGISADITPPTIPQGLSTTLNSYNYVILTWQASTDARGVSGYKVYRNGEYVTATNSLVLYNSQLPASTEFCYTVIAYDSSGNESAPSSQSCITTGESPDPSAPSIPSITTASAISSSRIDLSWSASTDNVGVTGYVLNRNGQYLTTVSGNVISYSDTGLNASTQYCYIVAAYDEANNLSDFSAEVCATTSGDSVPTSLTSTGDFFTVKDQYGVEMCSGSIGTDSSPYWPSNNYTIVTHGFGDVDGDGNTDIVILGRHITYYPGQVSVYNNLCTLQGRYWNPGHIYSLLLADIIGDSALEIMVGATNNDYMGCSPCIPAIMALYGNNLSGEAPPDYGSFPAGSEYWYSAFSLSGGVNQLLINGSTIVGNTSPDGSGTMICVDYYGQPVACP